jgi:hypothetical protein
MAKKFLVSIDLNGNEILNANLQNLAAAPGTPGVGRVYFDTVLGAPYQWNGTAWIALDASKVPNAYIPLAKLATDPLARANHTGTQLASTISNFDTQVRTSRLDQMSAPIASVSLNSQKIISLLDPTLAQDAATKNYVDTTSAAAVQSAAAGIDSKPSVRVIATSNIALTGIQTIDGVSCVAGDRVLATGQTTTAQNGVYVVAAGAWVRATDADATGEITPGAFWFVEEGTANNKTQWRCNNTGVITLGTTAITIVQFGAAQTFIGGAGMSLTGNTFDVGAGTGIVVGADTVSVDTTVVARKYAATVGTGAATSIVVTHNLASSDVVVSVREVATNNEIECDVQNTSANTVTLGFAVAPSTNSIRVSVVG